MDNFIISYKNPDSSVDNDKTLKVYDQNKSLKKSAKD